MGAQCCLSTLQGSPGITSPFSRDFSNLSDQQGVRPEGCRTNGVADGCRTNGVADGCWSNRVPDQIIGPEQSNSPLSNKFIPRSGISNFFSLFLKEWVLYFGGKPYPLKDNLFSSCPRISTYLYFDIPLNPHFT